MESIKGKKNHFEYMQQLIKNKSIKTSVKDCILKRNQLEKSMKTSLKNCITRISDDKIKIN